MPDSLGDVGCALAVDVIFEEKRMEVADGSKCISCGWKRTAWVSEKRKERNVSALGLVLSIQREGRQEKYSRSSSSLFSMRYYEAPDGSGGEERGV